MVFVVKLIGMGFYYFKDCWKVPGNLEDSNLSDGCLLIIEPFKIIAFVACGYRRTTLGYCFVAIDLTR